MEPTAYAEYLIERALEYLNQRDITLEQGGYDQFCKMILDTGLHSKLNLILDLD